MAKKIDITGCRFERLLAIKEIGVDSNKKIIWECRCDCGKIIQTTSNQLRQGRTKSCGCYNADMIKTRSLKHGCARINRKTREFIIWKGIKQRCINKNNRDYKKYGAKGIGVCPRWLNSFENFLKDMGLAPTAKHSIDRYPNGDGNYEPTNSRWATPQEQANNKNSNHILTFKEESDTLANWARKTDLKYFTLKQAIRRGDTLDSYFKKKGINYDAKIEHPVIAHAFGHIN